MGSTQSYRRHTTAQGRQSTQTLTNTIAPTVSCRNLLAVFQKDQDLALTDEAELAPGDRLERGRIFLKAPRLVTKSRVIGLEVIETFRGQAKFLAGPDAPGKTAVAE